ncbi:hypothetical protein OH76DRAFT_1410272 [Lentinus brumalis]|uniref:F-box domain-containing protein n=1 Tax=Lentinus brumalis TaxID=2498619 RepID=A0A371CSV1_9APHY|nr:hypothetical protein OH76DRAFT_1410272 [Polyporus brumalis]
MSSTSSPLGLGGPPRDIVDRIIDHLHCDTNTLITCALVARSWTPSAQFHIFSTIITHPDKPDRTMGEVAVWAKGRRVAQYVTTLVVQPFRTTTCPVIRTLELALPMMFIPNLRQVTLRNVYIRVHAGMAPPSQIRSASFRRPLTRLSIVSCRTQHNSFLPIGDLLCLFPAIDQLHFVNTVCSWEPPLESSSWFTFLLTGIRVRELYLQCEVDRMSHSGFKGFGHIIQRADPPWPLRTLRLSLPGMPQFPPLASFLNHSTKTLVDLRVDVIPSMLLPILDGVRPPTSEYWRTPILKEYISLRIMQLNFPTLLSNVPINDRAAVLAAFNDVLDANVELVLSAPPQLRTIIITFYVGTWDAQIVQVVRGLSAWRRLDEAVLRLRHLRSVTCIILEAGGLDVEAQIDLLRLPDIPSSSYLRTIASSESSRNTYPGIVAHGLPGATSAGLVRVAVMN